MKKIKRGKPKPVMNVTPLVDVVLVVLIIFMVITPLLKKKFWIYLPEQKQEKVKKIEEDDQPPVILSLGKEGMFRLNGTKIGLLALTAKLRRVYAAREDHLLFFDAADEANYGRAIAALDHARSGGALQIAILTSRPESEQ